MGSHIDDIHAPTTAHSVINIRFNQKLVKLKLKKCRKTRKIGSDVVKPELSQRNNMFIEKSIKFASVFIRVYLWLKLPSRLLKL
jgi:hypothetical protein